MFSNYHTDFLRTDCVLTFEKGDPRIEAIQRRLTGAFCSSTSVASAAGNASDPFLMHGIIAHESFMDSDPIIFDLGQQLYKTLDQLDEYASRIFDRDKLKLTTFQLHKISQDVDSLLGSADNNLALVQTLHDTQKLLIRLGFRGEEHRLQSSLSTSAWLVRAFGARKRWLFGARARKETAMNLVGPFPYKPIQYCTSMQTH